jgi:hypothetical protein
MRLLDDSGDNAGKEGRFFMHFAVIKLATEESF